MALRLDQVQTVSELRIRGRGQIMQPLDLGGILCLHHGHPSVTLLTHRGDALLR